jgi:hypothetical protein
MNGGPFPPHGSHQTGNDFDAETADGMYQNEWIHAHMHSAAMAARLIAYLNDPVYGRRI